MASERELIDIRPHKRQLEHTSIEFYAFFHFTVNTFTGREWGDGSEEPSIFYPSKFDAGNWIRAAKSAGMKGAILTCKHHDGFCLWPSKFTKHSVKNSPWQDGNGDIVKEVADACRKSNMKFGIYLSPWDRNHPSYGQGKNYDDYFIAQLKEILTNYGEIFSVWLDGACGEGKNGKVQTYDWKRYYQVIRQYQPGACITVCGPDVRWCGNEAGDVRPNEWSVVPRRLADAERIQESSQRADTTDFRQRKIKSSDKDLGSRDILKDESDLIWYPAEVNTSIRPGWFYHPEEDGKVKSLEELLRIYFGSVGGNATFLLNIPPTPEGLIHESDAARLQELGDFLRAAFSENLLEAAVLHTNVEAVAHPIEAVRVENDRCYFSPDSSRSVKISIEFSEEKNLSYIVLKEHIQLSQRVEKFTIEAETDRGDQCVYEGGVIGSKKIISVNIKCKRLCIFIQESRSCPTVEFIGIY